MGLVNIKIDGQAYQVEEGLTILEAARKCGFNIPSLFAFKVLYINDSGLSIFLGHNTFRGNQGKNEDNY